MKKNKTIGSFLRYSRSKTEVNDHPVKKGFFKINYKTLIVSQVLKAEMVTSIAGLDQSVLTQKQN